MIIDQSLCAHVSLARGKTEDIKIEFLNQKKNTKWEQQHIRKYNRKDQCFSRKVMKNIQDEAIRETAGSRAEAETEHSGRAPEWWGGVNGTQSQLGGAVTGQFGDHMSIQVNYDSNRLQPTKLNRNAQVLSGTNK